MRRRSAWILLGTLWICASAFGLWILLEYQTSAGNPGSPPSFWPRGSMIPRDSRRPVLVMLAHPQCPCTRSSIGELAWIMARAQERVQACVIFVKPVGFPENWVETDLWRTARSIPGVETFADPGGAEASRFGSVTSGQTLLYDSKGRLLFSGGITKGRGHSGDNAGRRAVLSILIGGSSDLKVTPVFGCSLVSAPFHPVRRSLRWLLNKMFA